MIGILTRLLRSLANALDGHETRRARIRRRLMLAQQLVKVSPTFGHLDDWS